MIGDCETAALVGRDGSIDWLCFPRFDSGACFAALLGTPRHGRWLIAPADPVLQVTRAYRARTLVLDTTFETASGCVTLTDCMPIRNGRPDVVRLVRAVRGRVPGRGRPGRRTPHHVRPGRRTPGAGTPVALAPWLPGYEGSAPVRIGNGAYDQFQLDVFGEVLDCLHVGRRFGLVDKAGDWRIERELLARLEVVWQNPDEGIWEVRGPKRHFTHSKLMASVAFDRALKDVERFGLEGPADHWRRLWDGLHAEICEPGFNSSRQTFVQSYDGSEVDTSLLMMAEVGFLPASDPRIVGTITAIERDLVRDGLVDRYRTESGVDGLPAGEGAFVLCTFWLADHYALAGRTADARRTFEALLAVRNDVGLLAEEFDPVARRQLGNFPQAFSHLGPINTARNLTQREKPAAVRAGVRPDDRSQPPGCTGLATSGASGPVAGAPLALPACRSRERHRAARLHRRGPRPGELAAGRVVRRCLDDPGVVGARRVHGVGRRRTPRHQRRTHDAVLLRRWARVEARAGPWGTA